MKFLSRILFLIVVASTGCTKSSTSSSSAKKLNFAESQTLILCFGDSLTSGYGLAEDQSYPALLQKKLSDQGKKFKVVNLGVNGSTTENGLTRLSEVWTQYNPAEVRLFVLALGGNDGLRQVAIEDTEKNLRGMLNQLKEKNVPTLLVGLKYIDVSQFGRDRFKGLFEKLADDYDVFWIEDILAGVRLKPEFNLGDGIHPNAAGTQIVFENLLPGIEKFLD